MNRRRAGQHILEKLEKAVSHGRISTVRSSASSNRGNRLSGRGMNLFPPLPQFIFKISNILWLSVSSPLFSAFILFFQNETGAVAVIVIDGSAL